MNSFNWQWWQYFLTIAEQGSLSKAAKELGVSQPTLSRQLLAMESHLGQTLFDRSTQGLKLTSFGQELLEECQHMQVSALRLQRLADGQSHILSGRIRLSANELIALYYLPNILPDFLETYPQLSVEVEVSNRASNLDKRDADVAIRMFPPTQLDLIARHLFDLPLGFFASPEYVEKHGCPKTPEDLFNYRLLGYDRDKQFEEGARRMGWDFRNDDFKFRTDFMPMHLEMAKRAGGIVGTHIALCERHNMVSIDVGIDLPSLPIYLVCHRDVQHNKRIRVMMDFLAEHLETALDNEQ
jgi:DNA-binding transcriptional LysR family regulator